MDSKSFYAMYYVHLAAMALGDYLESDDPTFYENALGLLDLAFEYAAAAGGEQ